MVGLAVLEPGAVRGRRRGGPMAGTTRPPRQRAVRPRAESPDEQDAGAGQVLLRQGPGQHAGRERAGGGRGEGERHAGCEGALGSSVCAAGGELPGEPDPPGHGGVNRREGDVDREMV